MDGKKTYAGIAAVLVGLFGEEFISRDEIESALFMGIQIAGLIFAVYGRYKARKIYGAHNGRGE